MIKQTKIGYGRCLKRRKGLGEFKASIFSQLDISFLLNNSEIDIFKFSALRPLVVVIF